MGSEAISSKNVANLLFKLNKQKHKELAKKSGDLSYVYDIGDVGGAEKTNVEALLETAKMTIETMKEFIANSHTIYKTITRRMKVSRNLELIPEIITVLLGSSLFIYLKSTGSDTGDPQIDTGGNTIELFAAIATTLSGLIAIFLNRGMGKWNYNKRNLIEDYTLLPATLIDAERLMRYLIPITNNFKNDESDIEELKNLLKEADDLSAKLKRIIVEYE